MNVCLEIDIQPIRAPQYGMGRPASPAKTCSKIGYPTRDAALRAVRHLFKRRKGDAERGIYQCRFCREFHLTSQEQR